MITVDPVLDVDEDNDGGYPLTPHATVFTATWGSLHLFAMGTGDSEAGMESNRQHKLAVFRGGVNDGTASVVGRSVLVTFMAPGDQLRYHGPGGPLYGARIGDEL